MRFQNSLSVEKKVLRLDEVHFIRSWLEKPLATGAVMPSGKALARTIARYVDPLVPGPVIELGPGTGAVTQALVEQGINPPASCWSNSIQFFAACCARSIRKRR